MSETWSGSENGKRRDLLGSGIGGVGIKKMGRILGEKRTRTTSRIIAKEKKNSGLTSFDAS